jgi:hypothetical protein
MSNNVKKTRQTGNNVYICNNVLLLYGKIEIDFCLILGVSLNFNIKNLKFFCAFLMFKINALKNRYNITRDAGFKIGYKYNIKC